MRDEHKGHITPRRGRNVTQIKRTHNETTGACWVQLESLMLTVDEASGDMCFYLQLGVWGLSAVSDLNPCFPSDCRASFTSKCLRLWRMDVGQNVYMDWCYSLRMNEQKGWILEDFAVHRARRMKFKRWVQHTTNCTEEDVYNSFVTYRNLALYVL